MSCVYPVLMLNGTTLKMGLAIPGAIAPGFFRGLLYLRSEAQSRSPTLVDGTDVALTPNPLPRGRGMLNSSILESLT
ncbi:MAG TPA: hypothetical protein V6D20_03840 [Candidatus Obscuribacterales bacterium]